MRLRQVAVALTLLSVVRWCSAADADCLFVEAATLNVSWPRSAVDQIIPADLNAIHRISGGSGIVAMLRSYKGKEGEQVDSEEFWKLTVELPDIASGASYVLPATAHNTRFSRAGSAWVAKGFGYVGADVIGTISARRVDEQTLTIDVSIEIGTRFAGDPAETQPLTIRKTSQLQRVQLADLTPWLGLATAGASDYWTTHRPRELRASCNDGQ